MHSKSLVYVGDGSVESDVSDSTSAAEERDITRATKIVRGQGLVVQQFTARETPKTREGILESFLQGHTNTVVAIRVLDEGFDLPSVSEAYLLASSRSERQFIQRRGRILRKSRGKDFAKVVDFLVFPPGHSESDSAKNLVINELIRAYEFVRFAKDNYESLVRLKEIMRKYDLNVDQIQDGTATREDYLSWMTS
jgi:superfamily II DNA or RNA helicase